MKKTNFSDFYKYNNKKLSLQGRPKDPSQRQPVNAIDFFIKAA
jgi:hypothetical protein